jgi:ParB/RepB/Spo0J family partition protein
MRVLEINMEKIKTLDNIRMREIEDDIHPLMASIESYGLLQPVGVFGTDEKGYVLVWGNRRYVAAKKLGLKKLSAVIVDSEEMSEEDFLIHNAIENIQRKEITTYELGKTCQVLREKNYSINEIAVKLSLSNAKVRNALSDFSRIPVEYRPRVVYLKNNRNKAGKISSAVSNSIIGIAKVHSLNKNEVERLYNLAHSEEMTYRELKLITIFLRKGLSVAKSISLLKEYELKEVVVAVPKDKLETSKKEVGTKFFSQWLEKKFNEIIPGSFVLNRGGSSGTSL